MLRTPGIRVEPYSAKQKESWDDLVRRSKNGAFIHLREYMEYHRDRFPDSSIVVLTKAGRMIAALPAHMSGKRCVSHHGLTFGGLIAEEALTLPAAIECFRGIVEFLHGAGCDSLVYRSAPSIYHRYPADEDRFILGQAGASVIGRRVFTAVNLRRPLPLQYRRRRGIARARNNGVSVEETDDFPTFWALLQQVLQRRFNTYPVHTLTEMMTLHSAFGNNIRLFASFLGDEMIAGAVIYEVNGVARAQYLASGEKGRDIGGLDYLIYRLLSETYADRSYFDLGSSALPDGSLNEGLIVQKEGFGGRSALQETLELQITEDAVRRISEILQPVSFASNHRRYTET